VFTGVTVLAGIGQTALVITQAWLIATIVTRFIAGATVASLATELVALGATAAGRASLTWLVQWLGQRAAARVKSELRREVLAARTRSPYGTTVSAGRLATIVGPGLDALDGWFARYLPQVVLAAVVPLVVVVAIGTADPTSAVIVALTLPLVPIFMVLVGLATQRHMDRRWRAQAVLGHHFADLVTGLTTLQVFRRARSQVRGLVHTERRHRHETLRTLRVAFLSALVLELVATLSVALVAVGVGLRVVDAQLALFPALFVLVLAPEAFLPLRQVGVHHHDAADGRAAAAEAFALIAASGWSSSERSEPQPRWSSSERSERVETLGAVSEIRFRDVATDRTVPLTASFGAGRTTVLVGPSGAGKTTALHLLLGWLEPTSGTVELVDDDGAHPLHDDIAETWRRQVAWVPQVPGLLPGTVADNLTLGAPHAHLREVLDRCGGADIELDQQVGDDGVGLSVGQRRRVALARALLRVLDGDARWLVLDEPTAGLDPASEEAVIAGLPSGVGVIMVSHRSSVTAGADHVLTVTAPDPLATGTAPESRPHNRSVTAAEPTAPPSSIVSPGLRWRWLGAAGLGVLASGSGVALLATAAWLLSRAAEHPPVLHLMVAVVAVRFFGIGKGVFRYAERVLGHQVALERQSVDRVATYRRLADRMLPISGRHDLVSRLTQDLATTADTTVRVWLPLVVAIVVTLGAVGFVASFSVAAAVVLAIGVAAAIVAAPAVGAHLTRRSQAELAEARGALAAEVGVLHELAAELSAYGVADRRLARAAAADQRLAGIEARSAVASGIGAAIQLAALGVTSAICLAVAGWQLGAAQLPATLVAVLALLPLALVDVVAPLPAASAALQAARSARARVAEVAAGPALPPERASGHVTGHGADDGSTDAALPLVAYGLAVGWPDAAPVLTGLDLTCRPGERLALVGPSGLGKSTLVATIAGLLPPRAGRLHTADAVAVLTQDAHLFDTTVRENLRLAAPGATDAELRTALARVGLALDLDRRVGEHGSTISGGEGRRLALARLVLSVTGTGTGRLVVLDEPTEHLDRDTAADLLTTVDRLWPEAAIVVVTHDPAAAELHLGARVVDLTPPMCPSPGAEAEPALGRRLVRERVDAPA